MSVSLVRSGIACLRGTAGRLLSAPVVPLQPQVATIVGKTFRDKDYKRPVPFNYKNDTYGYVASLFDWTTKRFDENTKIVLVEGPIAAGKAKFAKELAEDLDMMYLPRVNMDMKYINSYGYDLRQLDPRMPDTCKSFDEKNFMLNPSHPNAPKFQFDMFVFKLKQYIHALEHLLNTGQGVVMDRSVYSDFVFMETMVKFNFMSRPARNAYYLIRSQTVGELLQPHLVIYLDVPVEEIRRRLEARSPLHRDSPFHKPEVLAYMEQIYKQQYLKEISDQAELLIYDWSEEGEVEVVVEDIERIDFDGNIGYEGKFSDWYLTKEIEWNTARINYSKYKDDILNKMNCPAFSVSELVIPGEDVKVYYEVLCSAPGMKFAEGYNADQGDVNIFIK